MKRFIYPLFLSLSFLALITFPKPEFLREYLTDGLLYAAIVLIPLHLIFTQKGFSDKDLNISLWIIGLVGVLLTGIFWFRTSSGSYGFETGLGLKIAKTIFFWGPAVVFACLYRSDGEGWIPGSRRNLLIRLTVAVIASIIGMGIQNIARSQIDSLPMDEALHDVERQLPTGNNRIDYRLEGSTLHLSVEVDSSFRESNIQNLQRIRSISAHASHLVERKDTDSLVLRISRNGTELASLSWPAPATDRTADLIRFNYCGTELSNLPTDGDLKEIFDFLQPVFRPEKLAADLNNNTLILYRTGEDKIPGNPTLIPDIVHDWRAANHTAMFAASLFEGIDSFRIEMPGYRLDAPADSVGNLFRAQKMIPMPPKSGGLQIYDSEKMPELSEFSDNAPVRIIWGEGKFDGQRNKTGPLRLWERGTLAGYNFYVINLENDGPIRFVIHPLGSPEEARWVTLQPGEIKQVFTTYIRYLY